MTSRDWSDNWLAQVEEAVALRSILGEDFAFEADEGQDVDLFELYGSVSTLPVRELPNSEVLFDILTRPTLPEEGIQIQIRDGKEGRIQVRHLPPVSMNLQLPHGYPAAQAPRISLTAAWLSHAQLEGIAGELRRIAESCGGEGCSYSLVSWLQDEMLHHLGAQDCFCIPMDNALERSAAEGCSHADAEGGGRGGPSGHPEAGASSSGSQEGGEPAPAQPPWPEATMQLLLRYDATRENQLFQEGIWRCNICFEEVPGSQCLRAASCTHFFCVDCLHSHCQTQLRDKRLDMMVCPETGCKQPLNRAALVGSVLSAEEVEVWEGLELQRTLMGMQDVVTCPRCDAYCIEDADHAALCGTCHFAFCSLCQSTYHGRGQKCASVSEKLQILRERMRGNQDTASKLAAELKRREQELLSLATIKENAKECPMCGMGIEKNEGCNKMVCSVCGVKFCWVCMKRVEGYEHFQGSCALFDEAIIRQWNLDNQVDLQPVGGQQGPPRRRGAGQPFVDRRSSCTRCGQWNVKTGNLNLMSCWACGARYCYSCKHVLRKGEAGTHFRPTGCKQHSLD